MRTTRHFRMLAAALATMAAVACTSEPAKTDKAEMKAEAPPPPKPKTVDERIALYQRCWDDFNKKAFDSFKTCYADNITSEQMGSGQPAMSGPDATLAGAKQFAATFPDLEGKLQLVLAGTDGIVGIAQLNGTHGGPLPGPDGKPIPATNKPIGMVMGHVVRWDAMGEKAVREESYQDTATMLAQLGLSKAPARPVMAKSTATPMVVKSTGSETETKNVAAFKAAAELVGKHDLKAIAAENAPDVIFHDYTTPKDMGGKENIAYLGNFFKAFPDCKLVITSIWGAGDYVVAQGTFEGTNTGTAPAMGIKKATGKGVKVPFIEISKYENGKVKEDWLIYESMAFAGQLGLM